MATPRVPYDPNLDIWPDLKGGRIVLRPVRVGVNAKTGKVMIGWDHVEQSIWFILWTRYHKRPLRRWVGSFVPFILGETNLRIGIARFFWAIMTAIDLWEPNYRIQEVKVVNRVDGSRLTSVEELRQGKMTTRMFGTYRPRAHIGDETPEVRREFGLIGRGYGAWFRA